MALELSPSPRANLLAIVSILGVLAALALVWFGSSREVEQYGPTALTATEDGELYFAAAGRLYQADAQGGLLHSLSFAELGIEGPVAQLSMADGDLLLLDSGRNEVLRCDTGLWRCVPLIEHAATKLPDPLSFALAPEQGRFYLATLNGHRIRVYDLDGQARYTLKMPNGLKYVNDLQWLGEDRLLVTDTNHHRVVELEDLGEGEVRVVRQIEAANELGRKGRDWPTEARQDSQGGTWVINSNGRLSDSDLIYYDAEAEARRMIDLSPGTELSALAIYPGGVMASDRMNQQLIFVEQVDYSAARFGDESLQEALDAVSQQRQDWQKVYYIGVGVAFVFVSLGLVAGYLDRQARKDLQAESPEQRSFYVNGALDVPDQIKAQLPPDTDGIYWLAIKPESLGRFKIIIFGFPLMLIWLFYLIFMGSTEALKWPLYLSGGMLVGFYLGMLWFIQVALPRIRLGTDGSRLYLIDYLGRKASATPAACIKTESRLLIDWVAVPIKRRAPIFYDEALFAALIEPMLERIPKTSELSLYWGNLRRGDLATWVATLAIVLTLVFEIWFD
jgi:hypothetical protein